MSRVLRLFFATVLLISGAVSLWAQTADAPNYQTWQNVATRATQAVEAGRASDVALEELRQQLVDWRAQFDAARTTNANSIEIVEKQLAALGDKPASGTEPEDIAKQRQEISTRLSELQVPARLVSFWRWKQYCLNWPVTTVGQQTPNQLSFCRCLLLPDFCCGNWLSYLITTTLKAMRAAIAIVWWRLWAVF